MTIEIFNELPLNEQWQFIEKELNGQPYGIYNTILFEDKTITFLCSITGQCYSADAMPNPEEHKNGVSELLGEKHCINIIQDEHTAVKAKVFGAYQRSNNKMN